MIKQASSVEIEQLKQEINQMEDEMVEALQLFHKERASLLFKLNSMQASTRTIHPELLSYAFLLACDHGTYQGQKLAHTLGAVCRHWRTIALSTPLLWSSLVLFFGRNRAQALMAHERKERRGLVILLRSHLERVQTAPLSLTFLFDDRSPRPSEETLNLLSSLLFQKENIHKVQTLRLVHAPFYWILSFPPFPQLGYLGMYEDEPIPSPSADPQSHQHVIAKHISILPLLKSPRLYRLEVRGLNGLQSFYEKSRLVWLTHISLSRAPIDLCIDLLSSCPNLIQFEFSDPRQIFNENSPSKLSGRRSSLNTTFTTDLSQNNRIVLRHLQHFGWAHSAESNIDYLQSFYKRLRLPNLTSFYWWSSVGHDTLGLHDTEALQQLLPNLPSSLLLLKIHSAAQWSIEPIRLVCASVPSVQKLHLQGCDFVTMTNFLSVLDTLNHGDRRGGDRMRISERVRQLNFPMLRTVVMDEIDTYPDGEHASALEASMADTIISTLRSRCLSTTTAFVLEISHRDLPGNRPQAWSERIQDTQQILREDGIDFRVWVDGRKTRLLGTER